ncbi:MAG: LptF/LptG family permease [candidate division WOR-3 bacterium]|nr:MAG: LptF/LptG family permease [candidate division WOR-3 bacterium]
MIRLIDRYFVKEFVPPFFFSMIALTFILLMNELFRLIDLFVRKGLPIAIVGQILIYTLPLILSYTAPMAILVAVIMSFGRAAQDNEILALKTSGLPFRSIMRVPFAITLVFMIFLTFFNNYFLPESNHRVRNLMIDVTRKRPAVRLTEGIFTNEFPGYTIYIGDKDERLSTIREITIYDARDGILITAPRGDLKSFEEDDIIRFTLYDGELHQLVDSMKYQKTQFDKQILNMKLNTDFVRRERRYRNENELTSPGLKKMIEENTNKIASLRKEISEIGIAAVDDYLRGDAAAVDRATFEIERRVKTIEGTQRKLSRYQVALYKKFSLAFACLAFLIIGAPLGYLFKRGGIAGILVGVFLFSSYYVMVIAGEEFADRRNFSAFWGMWLPNIILLGAGIYMFLAAEFDRSPLRKILK